MQQQRPLASLVFIPTFVGVVSLALACVAGQRTDRLADTVMSDTLGNTLAAAADSAQDPAQVTTPVDSANLVPDSIAMLQGAPAPTRAPVVQTSQPSSNTHRHTVKTLSPLADSIANRLVFVPRDRAWFTVASRGKRMLVDIGRIDLQLKTDSVTRSAFLEAAERLSPLPNGTPLRVRGPWGTEDTRIKGFDIWSGRIVARLEVSRSLDSAARATDFLPGSAVRIDSAAMVVSQAPDSTPAGPAARKDSTTKGPTLTPCQRDNIPWEMVARGVAVRDSIEQFLADSVHPPFDRMVQTARVQSWTIPGCYGSARVIVLATKRTPDMEFATERVALIDSIGRAVPLRLSDLRFHAHEPLYVFDADGDGVDDLAVRGFGDRSGGLSIVRLDVAARRLVRLASGFAWER